jgi:maltooligosyltrehalose trehalohydrolase
MPNGGTHFRVWAPKSASVNVELSDSIERNSVREFQLSPEPGGYFSGPILEASPGMLYRYKLQTGSFPDPASRFQPDGPHGPSQIIDPSAFKWTDEHWPGLQRLGQVFYEMHVGTFTSPGTWAAAQDQLQELKDLGITVIELMPVAEFPGRFGWGYDGVDLFAPTRLYGQPDDLRRFVDQAHAVGLGVILDVVYNHFGPDGNYLSHFANHYFSECYENEWGDALNFDDEHSAPVREFFCANSAYWIQEFHLDGLRLDATQQMFDSSADNILSELGRAVRHAAKGKATLVIAENESQNSNLVRSPEKSGYGLDALWNDDFHHCAMVALSGHAEAYYSDYQGSPQELISTAKWGFIYQGQRSRWQKNPRGTSSFDLPPDCFINYLQNHDQVANSLSGLRVQQFASAGCLRAMTALLLLAPATPMLFQGQEFGASTPFFYFADHQPELSRLVAQGRRTFLSQFPSIALQQSCALLAPPEAEETFLRSKLNLGERLTHAPIYLMHRDLLRLRREDPVFSQPHHGRVDGALLGPGAFVLRFFGLAGQDRLVFVNLGSDLLLAPVSEPLLANPTRSNWNLLWSSESPSYGGAGALLLETDEGWRIPGQAAMVAAAG